MAKRYPRGHRPEGNSLGQCIHCFEPVEVAKYFSHLPQGPIGYYRHVRRKQPQSARDRHFCSSCGKPGEWYTFDPSGRCVACQP